MTWRGLVAIAVIASPATAAETPQVAIEAMMRESAAAWNAGDLDRFVAAYSDDAVYVSGNEVASGKAAIASRYAKVFKKGSLRGTLSLQPVAWRTLSPVHMLLVARWKLTGGAGGGAGGAGLTTLLYERRKTGWRIISDHRS